MMEGSWSSHTSVVNDNGRAIRSNLFTLKAVPGSFHHERFLASIPSFTQTHD